MMTARDLLLGRLDLLWRSVRSAEAALIRDLPDTPSDVDPAVRFAEEQARRRLRAEFRLGLRECCRSLDEVSAMAKGPEPLAECWSRYVEASVKAEALFGEILAFRLGALMRSETLDDGLFPVADALIRELAHDVFTFPPITVLAEFESIGHRSRIIRLRYPATIWEIPITAHEFGHLVASERNYLDFEDFIMGEKTPSNLLQEYFADIFATYALGPAFACAMILLRFEPTNAHPAFEWTHPGDAKRVHCILETLKRMEFSSPGGGFLTWVEIMLRNVWDESLNTVQQRTNLTPETVHELDAWLDRVLELFEGCLIANVKYSHDDPSQGWHIAQAWASEWHSALERHDDLSISRVESTSKCRDVLNAAWACRLLHPDPVSVDKIAWQANRVCETIYENRTIGGPPAGTK